MSIFRKLQEKKQAERIRKSEMLQGFTMQAELSATIVSVKYLDGDAEKTKYLVEYANGEKREEEAENASPRAAELNQYLG